MSEAMFSVNLRINDAQLTVRGNDYVSFSNNLNAIVDDIEWTSDFSKFYEAATGKPLVSTEQAVGNVQAAMPGAQVLPQAAATPPVNNFTCAHGQRNYREGQSKNGGTWSAWMCPVKGGCKPMSPDGTLWK